MLSARCATSRSGRATCVILQPVSPISITNATPGSGDYRGGVPKTCEGIMTTTDALQCPANGSRYGDQPANGRSRQWLDADDANIAALRAVPAESVSRRAVSWD